MCMMLIHESHTFEERIEKKFEMCEACSFFDATFVVTRKAWKILDKLSDRM